MPPVHVRCENGRCRRKNDVRELGRDLRDALADLPVWSKYSNAHPYERNHQHGPPPISLKLAQIPCHGFQTRIASESSLLLTDAIHEVGACRLTAF